MKHDTITFHETDIFISNHSKNLLLKYCDIVAITTDRPYIAIHTKYDIKEILINSTLHEIIGQLPCVFFLSNQSTIINLFYLSAYTQKDSEYLLYLNNGQKYKVARRKRKEFKAKLLYLKENCSLDCARKITCNNICLVQSHQEEFNIQLPNSTQNLTK